MPSTETGALIPALREVLAGNALLSAAGVFLGKAPREDALPYVLFSIAPRGATQMLLGKSGQWMRVLVKACTTSEGLLEGDELLGEVQALLREGWDGQTAQALLNAQLGPGWEVDRPIEVAPIQLYSDTLVGEVERWHNGLQFDLFLKQVKL